METSVQHHLVFMTARGGQHAVVHPSCLHEHQGLGLVPHSCMAHAPGPGPPARTQAPTHTLGSVWPCAPLMHGTLTRAWAPCPYSGPHTHTRVSEAGPCADTSPDTAVTGPAYPCRAPRHQPPPPYLRHCSVWSARAAPGTAHRRRKQPCRTCPPTPRPAGESGGGGVRRLGEAAQAGRQAGFLLPAVTVMPTSHKTHITTYSAHDYTLMWPAHH